MLLVPVQGQEDEFPKRTNVAVQNDLGVGFNLYMHCKSYPTFLAQPYFGGISNG